MSNLPTVRSTQTGLAINQGHTVLGERAVRLPVGGKIRAGIKVLTAAAKKVEGATRLYTDMAVAGHPWSAVEKALIERFDFKRSPLTPRNVPFFFVRPHDFTMPEVAARIIQMYGEDRGDGHVRLYRFPAIFATDFWQTNMPHALKHWSRSELVHWSEYGPDGTRYCKMHAAVQMDEKARRAHRTFGGRAAVLRHENDGRCVPEKCQEYQSKACTLSGSFLFYIPGIPGSSVIELPTNSFYSMQQVRQSMEMVAYLRGGKISGTADGRPLFWFTKKQKDVSMIDPETGKPKRVSQWLIELEADIDMAGVFARAEGRTALADGQKAASALNGPQAHDDEGEIGEDVDEATGEIIEPPEAPAVAAPPELADTKAGESLLTGLSVVGLSWAVFNAYAIKTWGEQWANDPLLVVAAAADVMRGADELDNYRAKFAT